jgi:hypothetical protein
VHNEKGASDMKDLRSPAKGTQATSNPQAPACMQGLVSAALALTLAASTVDVHAQWVLQDRDPSVVRAAVPEVNVFSRADVTRHFEDHWLAYAFGRKAAPLNLTGDFKNCIAGTMNPEAWWDAARVTNYFRRLAGLSGEVYPAPNVLWHKRAQESSTIQAANGDVFYLTHDVLPSAKCFTLDGQIGSKGGALATAPVLVRNAVSDWVQSELHRTLMLGRRIQEFGWGTVQIRVPDITPRVGPQGLATMYFGDSTRYQSSGQPTREVFTAFPHPGFMAAPHLPIRSSLTSWNPGYSFVIPYANFEETIRLRSIKVTKNGRVMPIGQVYQMYAPDLDLSDVLWKVEDDPYHSCNYRYGAEGSGLPWGPTQSIPAPNMGMACERDANGVPYAGLQTPIADVDALYEVTIDNVLAPVVPTSECISIDWNPRNRPAEYAGHGLLSVKPSCLAGRTRQSFRYQFAVFNPDQYLKAAENPDPVTDTATDAYWSDGESGWGVMLYRKGRQIFGTWYTYDADGNPTWAVMPGGTWIDGKRFTGWLYTSSYANPAAPDFFATQAFDASKAKAKPDGIARFEWQADGRVKFVSQFQGRYQEKLLRSFTAGFPAGVAPAGPNRTDIYAAAGEAGWGMSFNQKNATGFAALYAYDNGGKPLWLTLVCPMTGAVCEGNLNRVNGPGFLDAFDPTKVRVSTYGTARIEWTSADRATLTTTVNGRTITKTVERLAF